MFNKNLPFIALYMTCLLIAIFGSLYFYFDMIGEIEQAEIIYKKIYGENSDFNSIFWLCQKIISSSH